MMTLNARLLFALLIVLMLTILPLPTVITEFRPPWVLLLVLYIQFFLPKYFRLTYLFILGLCLDMLLSTVAGAHTCALILVTWLAAEKARRFNFFSIGLQIMLIALLCLVYQFIIFLIDAFLGYQSGWMPMIGTALTSMLFWPWLKLLADGTLSPEY